MNTVEHIKEEFERTQATKQDGGLGAVRQKAFDAFTRMGIPVKHEEWKYTRINSVFNKELKLASRERLAVTEADVDTVRLPGHQEANELVFVNGIFSTELSRIVSPSLIILPLEEAAESPEFNSVVADNLGHSGRYLKDGINALSTAFVGDGVFIHVKKGAVTEHPIYVYNITDTRNGNVLAQPRSLVHVARNAKVQLAETYLTMGQNESFTNQVMEVVVEQDAMTEYYKIQNDTSRSSQVSTTHLRQRGKSYTHTVTISLDGGIVRNNLNIVLDAEYSEAHLYGLYLQKGDTHVDNHTVVDNVKPNCYSNELYKGIMDGSSTGVFNGKIFVRPDAQKTNAYQSNKNVLLSDAASVNTKPQLEIFADDVKCSHGCTVGRLNDEGLFYLQSRGVPLKIAKSLLLHAFAVDILDEIKLAPIRQFVDKLISERLEFSE